MSGRLSTSKSPVLLAKSVITFILADFGDLRVRNGSKVDSTRARVMASRISSIIAGMVNRVWAWPRSVDIGGSFFMIGPVSIMRLYIGFAVSGAISDAIIVLRVSLMEGKVLFSR